MYEFIELVESGGVAVLTLSRPEVMNAWHSPMRIEVAEAFKSLDARESVRAVVVTGAGDRAFSAGQDFNEAKEFDADRAAAWVEEWRAMYSAIRELDKPLVAALNGLAVGSAFQVTLLADVRVGSRGVRLGQSEIDAGLPSTLGPWLMKEMIGLSRTIELTLTGRLMDGEECHAIGLIHRLVPQDQVMAKALETAEQLANKPPVAMRLDKRRFREITQPGFDEALNAAARLQRDAFSSGEPQRTMAEFLSEHGNKNSGKSNS